MKRFSAMTIIIAIVLNTMVGFTVLAEDNTKTVVQEPFIIRKGISEEEYNRQKSQFLYDSISKEQAKMGSALFLASKSVQSGNLLSNKYVEFAVNPENGRFTVGTVEGNPSVSTDNNKILLYGHDSPRTSYSTICVNDNSYIYGDSGFSTNPHFTGNSNVSEATFDNVQVKQEISIVKNSSTQREDIVEIKYTAKNLSSASQRFGLRIMLDTMLGNNDAAPFRIPGVGDLTTEREFSGEYIPQYWQAFDSLADPKVVSYGTFISGAINPNKVQFSNWRNVYNKSWNYQVSTGSQNGDSAVSIIWERTLAADAEETYVTRYGLSELLQDTQPPLALTIASGSSVFTNGAKDDYLPYTITAYVQNVGQETAHNVVCRIDLPSELIFSDEGESGIIQLGSLAVGQTVTVEKVIKVKERQTKDIITQYRVSVSADNAETKSLMRDLNISEVKYAKKGTFKYVSGFNKKHDSEATYYYSDAYFQGDSLTANEHLATMSLCLEMAAFGSVETTSWTEKTKNAKALLEEIGFSGFDQNDAWKEKPTMNTIGAVAAFKNIDVDTTVVALAVRGAEYQAEWGGNFYLGESGNHAGFNHAANEVYKWINDYVKKNKSKFRDTLKLWIVGYSRGAATANMIAGKLIDNGACGEMPLKWQNVFAYTFEAPQGYVGKDSTKYRSIHNYVNPLDIVPLVAPSKWNFYRYNFQTEAVLKWLGTKYCGTDEERIKANYKKILQDEPRDGFEIEDGEKEYNPEIFATKIDIDLVDTLAINYNIGRYISTFISGIPMIWLPPATVTLTGKDYDTSVENMLVGSMDSIFGGIPGGRKGYVQNVEQPLMKIAAFFNDPENKIGWSSAINDAFFSDYCEGVRHIVGIMIIPFRTKVEKAKDAARYATKRILDSVLRQTGTNLAEVETMLVNLLTAAFLACAEDLQQFFGFVYYLAADNGIHNHYPVVTFAAMMCYDSYYVGEAAFKRDYPQSYRIIHFNCPVDIKVNNDDGSTLATIEGEQVSNSSRVHGAVITENGTKQVILPSDAAYTINVHATDDGEMSVSVFEFDSSLHQYTLLQGYQNVSISSGDDYKLIIPEFIRQDYVDEEGNGSVSPYQLIGPNAETLEPTVRKTGEDIAYHHVELTTNNQKGVVIGGGDFVESAFAEIHAVPMPTVDFLGWYIDGKLVSKEPDYRFGVIKDTKAVAHFSEGNYHKLTVKATGGGQVNISELDLPETIGIELIAAPDEGYRFVRWEISAGTLEDAFKSDTMFTMPSSDAVITAVFADSQIRIEAQPQDQFVAVGQRATFSVMAEGEGLSYQWYINRQGKKGWVPIEGAIGSVYVTSIVDLTNDGYQYYCLITDVAGNSVKSDIATLHVRLNGTIPETGDSSKPYLWLLMILVGFIGLICYKKRNRAFK